MRYFFIELYDAKSAVDFVQINIEGVNPAPVTIIEPTPTNSVTPTVSITPTLTTTPSVTPTKTPSKTPTPTKTPTSSRTPTVTATPTPSKSPIPCRDEECSFTLNFDTTQFYQFYSLFLNDSSEGVLESRDATIMVNYSLGY